MNEEESIEEFARREMVTIIGAIAGMFGFIAVMLFVIFYTSPVLAAEYMVFPYNPEVRIVLSRQVCPGDKTKLLAVAQRIDKQYMRACWSLEPDQKLVRLQWEGGDFSIFDIDKFKPVTVQEKDKF